MSIRYYEIRDVSAEWDIHGGQFVVLVAYVTRSNFKMGKMLAGIFGNEWQYRLIHDLDTTGIDVNSPLAHFNSTEYLDVSQYLDDHIIPTLAGLGEKDLLEMFGGTSVFDSIINPSQKNHLNLYWLDPSEEDYYYGADAIKAECNNISNLLKECIQAGSPFEIYLE